MSPSQDRRSRAFIFLIAIVAVAWGLVGALGSALGWWGKLVYDYGEHF